MALHRGGTMLRDVCVEDSQKLSQHSFGYNLENETFEEVFELSEKAKDVLSKAESPSRRSMMYLLRNNVKADQKYQLRSAAMIRPSNLSAN